MNLWFDFLVRRKERIFFSINCVYGVGLAFLNKKDIFEPKWRLKSLLNYNVIIKYGLISNGFLLISKGIRLTPIDF